MFQGRYRSIGISINVCYLLLRPLHDVFQETLKCPHDASA
jgi:hypothetical protein